MLPRAFPTSHSLSSSNSSHLLYCPPQSRHLPHNTTVYPLHMDPSAVDFRAFYPYTPNEVKHRKRTTSAQLKILEGVFKRDTKPNAALRNELATQLEMTARGVQVWFQNRRAKEKNKTGKAAAVAKETDEPREPVASTESILLPQSNFQRDLPELGDSSSQESSPTGSSPPHLHVNTDSSFPSWQSSPLATPEDFRLSGELDACFIRHGSLPDNVFYNDDGSAVGQLDPFVRRGSVDASLHRLAANPYANLARAKNSALSGSRFPGLVNDPFSLSRSPSVSLASSGLSTPSSMSNFHSGSLHARHSSADSRTYRLSPHGLPVSPSPSPMSAYHSSIRGSLPDNQLFAFSTRPVSSPLPGPLPSPDFSFGVASSASALTSPASERNSPDNSHGFLFRGEDLDTEDDASASYGGYSRFGSIASIATSDSNTSAYYSDVSNCVDPNSGSEVNSVANHRRDSSGHFVGLMSGLNVGGMSTQSSQQSQPSQTTGPGESSARNVTVAPIPVSADGLPLRRLKDSEATSTYPSPTSTVSPGGSPGERNGSAGSSLSRELVRALQNKPEVHNFSPSQQLQQHNTSEVPFYLAEDRYSPITLPSASIEFAGGEFHFVARSTSSDSSNFGTGSSGAESYPVDALGHEHSSSQGSGFSLFDNVEASSTTSFI
jgi:hypothetical protein